ncbi:MAG: phosphate acyltransferase PlsX [Bacteroidales bacterium]
MIRIGIDAMGGDYAPENVILGAIEAYSHIDAETKIFLIGDQKKITEVCLHYGIDSGNFVIVHAAQVIEMGEHPVKAYLKKPNSSLNIGFNILAKKEIDAFASAGNTGAMLAGSMQTLNTLPGVLRPCISAHIPLANGKNMLILDVGFNSDTRPDVLYQFAILGSIYARTMMGIENPRVALLNIGEEGDKGNIITKEAYKLMSNSLDFNFIGNMEANLLFSGGIADVLVTDGFVGNICLKQAEGMYALVTKLGVNHPFLNRFNYEYYGGTPVLGVSAPVIIGHGASTPLAIKNMILEAEKATKNGLIDKLRVAMKQ